MTVAHILVLVGRTFALSIGSFSFYLAFFIYEDEDGRWQNKIDHLWIGISDRAMVTNSVAAALFNKTAQGVLTASNGLFGKRAFSLQAVSVSVNLSIAGAILAGLFVDYEEIIKLNVELTPAVLALVESSVSAYCTARFRRSWVAVLTLMPALSVIIVGSWRILSVEHLGRESYVFLASFVLLPIISVASDVLAVALIRQALREISRAPGLGRMLLAILILACAIAAMIGVPMYAIERMNGTSADPFDFLRWLPVLYLLLLNITAGIYCLVPIVCLSFLVVHRLFWPSLSRVIYPLCRFHIFTNRKFMISVGVASFTVALGLEHFGIKELLKLLG
jgi:hypothetical protein